MIKIKILPQIIQIDTSPILNSWFSMEITGENLRSLWRKSFLPRLFALFFIQPCIDLCLDFFLCVGVKAADTGGMAAAG